jgi:hypothetical protein
MHGPASTTLHPREAWGKKIPRRALPSFAVPASASRFMTDLHRFVPSRRAARTEYLAGAVAAFVLVAAILYLREGERSAGVVVGLGLGAAALVMMGYFVRTRFQWVDELHLSADGVTEVRGGKPRTLPWTAVADVRRFTRGGEQWVLSTHRGHMPMTIRTDGLSREEATRLRELIPTFHAGAGQARSHAE